MHSGPSNTSLLNPLEEQKCNVFTATWTGSYGRIKCHRKNDSIVWLILKLTKPFSKHYDPINLFQMHSHLKRFVYILVAKSSLVRHDGNSLTIGENKWQDNCSMQEASFTLTIWTQYTGEEWIESFNPSWKCFVSSSPNKSPTFVQQTE